MRVGLAGLAVLALAACDPEVPDSAAGVGFGDYSAYSARREAQLRGQEVVSVMPPPAPDAPAPVTEVTPDPVAAATTAAPVGAPLSAMAPQPATAPQPVASAPVDTNNPGISDEQSFAAVSSRETIESDRARLEQQRQQYQVIEPEPLPGRSGATGPNIVQYALNAPNSVGQPRYRRGARVSDERLLQNCAKYRSPDLAQQAFLSAGGPQRDKLNLDPDGDGFACYWDPTPFRAAAR